MLGTTMCPTEVIDPFCLSLSVYPSCFFLAPLLFGMLTLRLDLLPLLKFLFRSSSHLLFKDAPLLFTLPLLCLLLLLFFQQLLLGTRARLRGRS